MQFYSKTKCAEITGDAGKTYIVFRFHVNRFEEKQFILSAQFTQLYIE